MGTILGNWSHPFAVEFLERGAFASRLQFPTII